MIDWQALSKREQQSALARPEINESGLLSQQGENILNNVKRNGDKALYELTEKSPSSHFQEQQVSPTDTLDLFTIYLAWDRSILKDRIAERTEKRWHSNCF